MSDVAVDVYRAPMRSRRDDIDFGATIERARSPGVCGFGGPSGAATDDRQTRRIERFREVNEGSFAWTRDPDGLYWLGRIVGPYFYDSDDGAAAVDLVHVRECRWLSEPLLEPSAPRVIGSGRSSFSARATTLARPHAACRCADTVARGAKVRRGTSRSR